MADTANSEEASSARIVEDRALLAAFHRGDDAAARELWARHAGALRAYAGSLVGDAAADDVVQAVFLGALRVKRSQIRGVRDPAAWLCTLTRNAALNSRRAAGRATARDRDARVREPDPDRSRDDLSALLERMPARLREAVVLRHAYGFTLERLAEALGVSRSVAADRYARGIALARESNESPVRSGGHQHVG
ncbi:MAG: sigma-70 family RNA polymerase sigma factor [Phycisphaera sp.]|nr:MAG: sigma-70 family RNA polymerase sigma factor [Phycisphaera sp.]